MLLVLLVQLAHVTTAACSFSVVTTDGQSLSLFWALTRPHFHFHILLLSFLRHMCVLAFIFREKECYAIFMNAAAADLIAVRRKII